MGHVQIRIGSDFPIILIFYANGRISFIPYQEFSAIIDNPEDGVEGIFDLEGFSLRDKNVAEFQKYMYNMPYEYKTMEVLKKWLIQQNLIA